MKIAITGSIACGKSKISEYLVNNGYVVIDTDKLSYSLSLKGNLCYNRIVREFKDILLENGEIDRKKLGTIVFNDENKRKLLESIIHPAIIKEIEDYKDEGLVFFEVPLLYEVNLAYLFSKVIVVSCKKEMQLERLMKRNNLTEEEALVRINSQMDIKEKEKLADFIIDNNESFDYSIKQLEEILKGLK